MRQLLLKSILFLIMIGIPSLTFAQSFGKNKVQYNAFDWRYIETPHFTIHYYDGCNYIAEFAAEVMEAQLTRLQDMFEYQIRKKIPVVVYKSHNDFQQTNVIPDYMEEGIGGVTELFKNRIVVPFEGSYEQFYHVLRHELVHGYMNDMIYGGSVQSILSSNVQLQLPLWFAEGLAEYLSLWWDTRTDMVVRDATINDYLKTKMSPYPQGQSIFKHIEEKYGAQKVADVVRRVNITKDVDKGIRSSLGIDSKKLLEEWEITMKRKYYPDIANREQLGEFATRLTDHRKRSNNYLNLGAAMSPTGDKVAFLTDRDGYNDIMLMSAVDGKLQGKILKGQRNASLEELHWLSPGMSWSPDGKYLALSVKAGSRDALTIIDVKKKDVKQAKFDLDGVFGADWSPQGDELVFQGTKNGAADIYTYNWKTKAFRTITHDYFTDSSPAWSPDGTKILFVSDRKDNVGMNGTAPVLMQFQEFMTTDIYIMNVDGSDIERLTVNDFNDDAPVWAPDGKRFAYISEANGISNVYIYNLETRESYPITNALSGCYQLSWSKDGSKLVFSSFVDGGWDVFMIKNPLSKESKASQLKNTVFFNQIIAQKNEQQKKQESIIAEKLANEERKKYTQTDLSQYIFDERLRNRITAEKASIAKAEYDSTKYKTASGKYKEYKYKLQLTPDYMYGNYGYNTFYGIQGSSVFQFSDILGNHTFLFASDLYFDLKNSSYQLFYLYLSRKTDYGIGIHNYPYFFTSFYNVGNQYYQIDYRIRDYGIDLMASHPFSKYTRVDYGFFYQLIEQYFFDEVFQILNEKYTVYRSSLDIVRDTSLWGIFGPVDGIRAGLTINYSPPIGDKISRLSFCTVMGDYRKYKLIRGKTSFAFRLSGGYSDGETPERFFLGGVDNWINRSFKGGLQTDLKSVFFSYWVTPLRGYPYYEITGSRYGISNTEFRFPFVEALLLGWPTNLVLQNITGSFFFDIGSAWDGNNFKATQRLADGSYVFKDLRSGFGTGINWNLFGWMYFRTDIAWRYDLKGTSKPIYYFSFFGGDW